MQTQTLCAQVAATLGEHRRLIERRGFQPARPQRPLEGARLQALDCPFCGQQVLVVAPRSERFEAECPSCDTAFEASAQDVYRVSLAAAEFPRRRNFAVRLV